MLRKLFISCCSSHNIHLTYQLQCEGHVLQTGKKINQLIGLIDISHECMWKVLFL